MCQKNRPIKYAKRAEGWRYNTEGSIFVTVHSTWLGFAPVNKYFSLGAHSLAFLT